MYSLIVFLPLTGAVIVGLFGRALGDRASMLITSGFVTISAILSGIAFFTVPGSETQQILVANWITSGALNVDWALRIDTLTAVMLIVVNGVSALVHWYSIGYMDHDPSKPRFFAYLSLFTFAMLMLVTADNFVQMFFGWEGVGLASYLLIGFWYKKPSANAAAIKAFIVNRVGDFGFALGIFATFVVFGSLDFDTIFAALPDKADTVFNFLGYEVHALTTIGVLLFIGAMGKSAQFILHTWLPDAMEGPTPVSALIHAATMVTAGVFLVVRLSPLYEMAPAATGMITFVGATTAFFAATVALVQNDIKRVVAYSTCSQLGYMFFAAGVGAYGAAMFHLFTHAFFKALLFLGSGSVIHALHDEQDMRRMGGMRKVIPKTFWLMVIGTVALTGLGIPYLFGFAGFYSKDIIIESAYAGQSLGVAFSGYAFWTGVIVAGLTSFYSWRLIFMTFFGTYRGEAHTLDAAHESPNVMLVPLYVLAAGAIFAGVLFAGNFTGEDRGAFWNGSIAGAPMLEDAAKVESAGENQTTEGQQAQEGEHVAPGATIDVLDAAHAVPVWVKLSPFVASLLGLLVSWYFYIRSPSTPKRLAEDQPILYRFLLNKWYFDEIYDFLFVRGLNWLGRVLWKVGDGKVIDGLGPDGISALVSRATKQVVRLQTGYLYHYAFAMLIGVAAFISFFMYSGGGQ